MMNQFIDSTIIIGAFTPNKKRDACQNTIRRGGIINGLVLIECFDVIERITKNREYALKAIKSLMSSNLEIINLTNGFIFEAMKISNKYDLKIFDLIHYTTAMMNSCSEIISYDSHFDHLDIKRSEP